MKEKLAALIVDHRCGIAAVVLVIALACTALIPQVSVNNDLTKYLPDSSPMKQGVDLMASELPGIETPQTIRVMFDGLSDQQRLEVAEGLAAIEGVDSVAYEAGSPDYNQGEHALFVLSTSYDYDSPQEVAIENAAEHYYGDAGVPAGVRISVMNDGVASAVLSPWLVGGAIALLVAILFILSQSWVEPLLYLLAIGCAVGINMGTNIVQGQISQITFSIAAVLQLVLSMDYSIVLMNRYRQELAGRGVDISWHPKGAAAASQQTEDTPALRVEAMKAALSGAFTALSSSSLTTFVGLLTLVFMTFKIGGDLGVVLAKGVLVSLLCVMLLLPGLILGAHAGIVASAKPVPQPKLARLAGFEHRFRWPIAAGFIVLLVASYFLQSITQITYTLDWDDRIVEVFPKTTQVVVLYDNDDEDAMAAIVAQLEADDRVRKVAAWSNTLGKPLTQDELADAIEQFAAAEGADETLAGFDTSMLGLLFSTYQRKVDEDATAISIAELARFIEQDVLTDPFMKAFVKDDQREAIGTMQEQIDGVKSQMVGPSYSIAAITIATAAGTATTDAFMDELADACDAQLSEPHYLIGDAAMVREMRLGFGLEMLTITLISAGAIFLVVALAFRSLAIPAILVLVVQCGVYLTVIATGLQGYSIYYLAQLIVQCILMGATIDYGILLTNNYREARRLMGSRDALAAAYAGSIHTIMTSGLIITLVTAAIGVSGTDPTIAQICRTISMGAASAVTLILLFLPGMLAAFDRFTAGRGKAGS